mgnify:FL=1
MKKLIISCDDLGISKETNLGIRECLDKGVATSSSIIANGEFYDHALENVINQTPNNFYGLHLNLTEGKALNKNSTNILSDNNNEFKISASKYFLLNFYRSNKNLENAVYEELKVQITKVLNDGIKLSHFDSHEHIHHSPWLFKIITVLGKEFKINKIRFVNEKIILKTYFKDMFYKLMSLNYLKHLIINICNTKVKNSLISPDYFFGILNSGKLQQDEFFLYLEKIGLNKIIELCVHPANKIMDKIQFKRESIHKNFYSSKNRINEKFFLLSDEFSNFLKQKNIRLINFSDLS